MPAVCRAVLGRAANASEHAMSNAQRALARIASTHCATSCQPVRIRSSGKAEAGHCKGTAAGHSTH